MSYAFAPRLDSKVQLTGVYLAPSDKTAWTLPFDDSTIDTIVTQAGEVVPVESVVGGVAFADGNYAGTPAILGRSFTMSVELTRPFRRDQNNKSILGDRIQVETLTAEHRNAGAYTIRAAMPNRTDRVRELSLPVGTLIESEGSMRTFLNGDAKTTQWFLESDSPLPVTIAAVSWDAEVSQRSAS